MLCTRIKKICTFSGWARQHRELARFESLVPPPPLVTQNRDFRVYFSGALRCARTGRISTFLTALFFWTNSVGKSTSRTRRSSRRARISRACSCHSCMSFFESKLRVADQAPIREYSRGVACREKDQFQWTREC